MSSNLQPRQLATVIAALRHWQRHQADNVGISPHPIAEDDIATDGGKLKPMRSNDIDEFIDELQGAELTYDSVAAANGWTFTPNTQPNQPPAYWTRLCRHGEGSNDHRETDARGKPVITASTAKQACAYDGLTLADLPAEGTYDVMVQQYVEEIATVRVRAESIDGAIAAALDSQPGVTANWRPGDGAEKVSAWAVNDHTGTTVWER